MERFFELARKMSFKSPHKPAMGSIITYKGRILGLGFNSCRSHPRANNPYSMLHAEVSAIINARKENFEGCDIFVYRELKDGTPALAKPCQYCYNMIKSLGFKSINYSDSGTFKSEYIK